jgi:hypothetical protein
MKKTLPLLVAAVLAVGLVISCSQPSSFEVTLTPGSAESVSTEAIKYSALAGGNLVSWDGANDGSSYQVYRKTVDADNNPVDSSILSLGNGTQTNNLSLWYYLDTAVKNGEKYQYGIVTVGYKDAANGGVVVRSEIAWQAETDTNKYAAANVPVVGSKFSVPSFPEVKIDMINSVIPGTTGLEDFADKMLVTISNLDPFYSYALSREYSNDGTELNYGSSNTLVSDIWGSSQADRLSNYLENGTTIQKQYISGWADAATGTIPATATRRLVVTIDVANTSDYTLEYTGAPATTSLSSRQKSWAIPRK